MGLDARTLSYAVKNGASFLAHQYSNTGIDKYKCVAQFVEQNGKKILSAETRATIGDAAFAIEAEAKANQPWVEAQAEAIFGKLSSIEGVSARSKSALSTVPKLERCLVKETPDQVFRNLSEASSYVMDANGVRFFLKSLPKLEEKEIHSMIKKMTYDGNKLTEKQKKLLLDYIYENPIKKSQRDEAFRLYEQFAQPLIEKRSGEVVDQMTLGILKHRMNNGEFTLQELKKSGLIDEKLISRLSSGEIIEPMDVTRITNYRGRYGLPEFSNDQVRQLSIALDFKNLSSKKVPIYSDPRGLNYRKYSDEDLKFCYDSSIKNTGYRSAQVNVNDINGARTEYQFRGFESNEYCEMDHLGYDFLQGKGTLGSECDGFVNAMKSLSKRDKAQYNEYKHAWFNYYQRLELGLPAKQPRLNPKFSKLLSTEYGYELYNKSHTKAVNEARTFVPHFSAIA